MSTSEQSALLNPSSDPPAKKANPVTSLESTPLLIDAQSTSRYDGEHEPVFLLSQSNATRDPLKLQRRTWPYLVVLVAMTLAACGTVMIASIAPSALEDYAKNAAVIEPTNIALERFTHTGVRIRFQAHFWLDSQRVQKRIVRSAGKLATWFIRDLTTGTTELEVRLARTDGILLGTAVVPPIHLSLEDGRRTVLDFVTDLNPGDVEGIRTITDKWLSGRLSRFDLVAQAEIALKSGLIPLGRHTAVQVLTIQGDALPDLPKYDVSRIRVEDNDKGMRADVSLSAYNGYPFTLDVPVLEFNVLVAGCSPNDPHILVANAITRPVAVRPASNMTVGVRGLIKTFAESLVTRCPGSKWSPLDRFIRRYMDGDAATVLVRGKSVSDLGTPDWLAAILASITVPISLPGRSFGSLIRNFSLTDVHFTTPDPLAEPGTPAASPRVSGGIEVLAAIPSEMNFELHVTNLRATANVSYSSHKLGDLNLHRWQAANSTRLENVGQSSALLKIQSAIKDAPLDVADSDVLTEIMQKLLFGDKNVVLEIGARVDIQVQTVLGRLVLKDVPAEGKIPVKPVPAHLLTGLRPSVSSLDIVDSGPAFVTVRASVNMTNPTPYSAYIPSASMFVVSNGSVIGEAKADRLSVSKGLNRNLIFTLRFQPGLGGADGVAEGPEFLSRYVSGFNTSLTIRAHRGSFPFQPLIGEALSRLNITVSTPRLNRPNGDEMHFIQHAVFHLLSSTASFTLLSPFRRSTLWIDAINGTAFYDHTEVMGTIDYGYPFAAAPGLSTTPKLPVQWSPDSIGYDKVRKALGGRLELDARAVVNVRLGAWKQRVWFVGKGIGAHVRL